MIIYVSSGVFNTSGGHTSSFIYDESADCFILSEEKTILSLKKM